jgi:serine/threonine-protein kinase RsbW
MSGATPSMTNMPVSPNAISMLRLTTRTESGMLRRREFFRILGADSRGDTDSDDQVVMIRLSVPGTLQHRDLVLRVVASSCKLLRSQQARTQEPSHPEEHDDQFDNKVVSAVGEVFNNIAIHGYAGRATGAVDIEIDVAENRLILRVADTGESFDLAADTALALPNLPESHMGLYIVRSFMDEVRYEPGDSSGRPNVLILTKRY